jgi:hypothetical protein
MPVDTPGARSDGSDGYSKNGEDHDVLPALTGSEDKESILQVVRNPSDQHDSDDPGATERRQQADDHEETGTNLGQARRPCVDDARTHAQPFEPTSCTSDLPTAEYMIDTVGDEDTPQGDPRQKKRSIHRRRRNTSQDLMHNITSGSVSGAVRRRSSVNSTGGSSGRAYSGSSRQAIGTVGPDESPHLARSLIEKSAMMGQIRFPPEGYGT